MEEEEFKGKEELKQDIKKVAEDVKELSTEIKAKVQVWTEKNPRATKMIIGSAIVSAFIGLGFLLGRKKK